MQEKLKPDHPNRPILIVKIEENLQPLKQDKDRKVEREKRFEIILERFHKRAKEAEVKLIKFAEPYSITTNF